MGGLYGALELGRQSLIAQQLALQVTGHNIANINTPGYSRQDVYFEDTYTLQKGIGATGMGVNVKAVEGFRDRFLEIRLNQEAQNLGAMEVTVDGLASIESVLVSGNAGIRESLQQFFHGVQALTQDPANLSLRTDLIAKGNRLVSQVQTAYSQLQDIQYNLDAVIPAAVREINDLSGQIAGLNQMILEGGVNGGNVSDLKDQRAELARQLGSRIGVMTYEDNRGMLNIQTEGGAILVAGNASVELTAVKSGSDPFYHIYSGPADMTASITKGELGGRLQIRDQNVPEYLTVLDNLAGTLTEEFNAIHQNGYDLDNDTLSDFFQPFTPPSPGDYTGAARLFAMNISDPRDIAASGAMDAPGNNTIALALSELEDQPVPALSARSFSDFWQNNLTNLGVEVQSSSSSLQSRKLIVSNLQDMRDSVSGVSLDEEAVKLIEYQRGFEAMSRYLRTVDELLGDLLTTLGG